MSFSKAKLHRFNDEKVCAPPPGTYTPAMIDKTVGPIINKSERFGEKNSLFHSSSSESINSLYGGGGGGGGSGSEFKTPKVPYSAGKFKIRYAPNFSRTDRKACSTEYIDKKAEGGGHAGYEINSLKFTLNEIQEELALERNKTDKLLKEIKQLKKRYAGTENHTDYLIEALNEKCSLISALEGKYDALQRITVDGFESYYKHITGVYSTLEEYFKSWQKSDAQMDDLFEKYETVIREYEKNFEEIASFLSELLRNADSTSLLEHKSELVEKLNGCEKERKKYELVVQEMRKVINVLSERVLESDEEVEKLANEKQTVVSELTKKNEQLSRMESFIDAVKESFVDRVQSTEKDLLGLVDALKETALAEKKAYLQQVEEKNIIISDLLKQKDVRELQLQESLDQIEILKCKEETNEGILRQLRDECDQLKRNLQLNQGVTCHSSFYNEDDLVNLTADAAAAAAIKDDNDGASSSAAATALESDDHFKLFAKHLLEFQNQRQQQSDKINSLYDFVLQAKMPPNEEEEEEEEDDDDDCGNNLDGLVEYAAVSKLNAQSKVDWINSLLRLIYNALSKFKAENCALKNDFTRLRNDFVEKCDECAQLTQLLQLSEKRVEHLEKREQSLELSERDYAHKTDALSSQIEDLETEKSALEERLTEQKFETRNNEIMIETLNQEINKFRDTCTRSSNEVSAEKIKQLEKCLKESQTKTKALEKENSKLNKLIDPFKQTLEKYETESKCLNFSNENVMKKYSKLLDVQNHKNKIKEITKLRNDAIQLRKKNDDLQTELNKYKKVAIKPGKENKVFAKQIETNKNAKLIRAEVHVNSTYLVTSPKVNRI